MSEDLKIEIGKYDVVFMTRNGDTEIVSNKNGIYEKRSLSKDEIIQIIKYLTKHL